VRNADPASQPQGATEQATVRPFADLRALLDGGAKTKN
jgi:hypothetical protein